MVEKNKNEYGWIIAATIVIILTIGSACFMPTLLTKNAKCEDVNFSQNEDSNVGDTIGGITAPFIGVGAAILTFFAFWVQYQFNQKQSNSLRKERFEHNFYELLHLHESITSELSLDITSNDLTVEDNIIKHSDGRDVFKMLYLSYPIKTNKSLRALLAGAKDANYNGVKELMEKEGDNRFETYSEVDSIGFLDHYFRQLYRIFKYIYNANGYLSDEEQYEYAGEVRATLSQYELVMLFYNCLSSNGNTKFKGLIERYAVLKNLRFSLLADENDIALYKDGAYEHTIKPKETITQKYLNDISQ